MSGWPDNDPVRVVFKIGPEDYMGALFAEGCVYMNTAGYFAKAQDDPSRHDADEGTGYCQQDQPGIRYEVEGERIPGRLASRWLHRSGQMQATNIYSLHAKRRSYLDSGPFRLDDFGWGKSAVLFHDFAAFWRRLTTVAAREGYALDYDLVAYLDQATHSGEMDLFTKFKDPYERESELRIIASPATGKPLIFRVGSLKDIATLYPTTDNRPFRQRLVRDGA